MRRRWIQMPEMAAADVPLTELVRSALREDIVSGQLRPGERIVQDSVARRFGTSRIPVREALRELASEGLVMLEPDVGARVAKLNAAELIEVYLMREALEPIAVARSAPRISDDAVAELHELVEEIERRAQAGDMHEFLDLDRRFHEITFSMAELPRIQRVIDGLANTTTQYRRIYSYLPDRLAISHVEHRLLVDAFERRAGEDAAAIHQLHTRRTRVALSQMPDIFDDPDLMVGGFPASPPDQRDPNRDSTGADDQ
jgi:GntR family transcriptional regulator, rspAB operon transcriptional repressor